MSSPQSEQELARWLEEVIFEATYGTKDDGLRIRSFAEASLLTANEGLVLSFPGGGEFHLIIVRRW